MTMQHSSRPFLVRHRAVKAAVLVAAGTLMLSGCDFSPYSLPLPGGAKVGKHPYTVTAEFRDVLDLVPQSAVRVNDVAVGKITKITLDGWDAKVTMKINRDAKLPDNVEATIRQTSLLGEKFVSLAPPATGAQGRLGNGDNIPLAQTGRNPEIEEVLGAASLIFNGGGLEKTQTIVRELNKTLGGNEPEVRELLSSTDAFIGQLDDNKQSLITTLEKVNHLAVETNAQKKAIVGALDNLPAALQTVNDQRADIVKLLESLSNLSGVATNVVKESKADTIANLKALQPILANLAKTGDHLVGAFRGLLTFPFTDAYVGNTPAEAAATHLGDYGNLALRLDISAKNLGTFLGLGSLTSAIDSASSGGTGSTSTDPTSLAGLTDLVAGLVPKASDPSTKLPDLGGLTGSSTTGSGSTGSGSTGSGGGTPSTGAGGSSSGGGLTLPGFCSLLGKCRTAADSAAYTASQSSDLGRLLVDPVVVP